MKIKRVSIVGCGAIGIMYASHMLRYLSNDQVQFIADPDRIERYKKADIYANGIKQSFSFSSPDDAKQLSDLVIFTVKYNGLRDAVKIAKNHIGKDTIILSFLNGISSENIISETYDPDQILYSMIAGMDATKTGYSVNFTKTGYVSFNSLSGISTENVKSVADLFDKVQIKYENPKDIMKALWWKFILNIGINQTSALLRSTYGLFHSSGYAKETMRMAVAEAYEVSCKLGVGLDSKDIEKCFEIVKTLSPDGKTSMCQDIEAKRHTEIDMFAGTLIELGKEYGVPTPVNTFLFNAIKAMERA